MELLLSNSLEFLVNVAQAAASTTVGGGSTPLPTPAPGEIVKNIYNFALMLGGILAFGMIVFGAVKYTLSGGNPSGQSDARDIVTQALLGLLLLVGVFIVLNLINPSLTRLNLPELGKIKAPEEGQLPVPPIPPSGYCGSPPNFVPCESLAAVGCKTSASCSAYPGLEKLLLALEADSGVQITVTESMPPTSTHQSSGHQNGCSVDIRVEGVSDRKDCDKVQKVFESAALLGFSAANEYSFCPGGAASTFSTGGHIHLTKSNCP
jgi:hypothetical protein